MTISPAGRPLSSQWQLLLTLSLIGCTGAGAVAPAAPATEGRFEWTGQAGPIGFRDDDLLMLAQGGKIAYLGTPDWRDRVGLDLGPGASVVAFDARSSSAFVKLPPSPPGRGATLHRVDTRTGADLGRLEAWDDEDPASKAASGFVLSGDGRILAACGRDPSRPWIGLWDAASGARLRTIEGPYSDVHHVALSTSGRRLAVAHGDRGQVSIFDVATGALERQLHTGEERVWALAFSPTHEDLLVAATDAAIRRLDAATGVEQGSWPSGPEQALGAAFSPDGTLLATLRGETIDIHETATWRRTESFEVKASVSGLRSAFSPSGRALAVATIDPEGVVVFDLAPATTAGR
jgi:WD40 repeat protein